MLLSEIYHPGITMFMVGKGRRLTTFRPFSGNLQNEAVRDLDPITTLLTENEKLDILTESAHNLAYQYYIIDEYTREDMLNLGVSEMPSCKSIVPWASGTTYKVSRFWIQLPYKVTHGEHVHVNHIH